MIMSRDLGLVWKGHVACVGRDHGPRVQRRAPLVWVEGAMICRMIHRLIILH